MKQFTTLLLLVGFFQLTNAQNRVVTTGVPFLNISTDARASGLGDQGVATSADAFSSLWNPAKFAFIQNEMGAAVSYTPYLSKLVNDIFLADLNYYKAINDRSAWAVNLHYFSLGELSLGQTAEEIVNNPQKIRPNEFSLGGSYALKLSENFSMAIQGMFINSDLRIKTDAGDNTAASSVAVGISGFYESFEVPYSNFSGIWRAGFNISNIGPKLKYDDEGVDEFLPTNLRLGGGFDFIFDSYNKLAVTLELNKLLVPSPSVLDDKGNYSQPDDVGVLSGIFKSFGDAPDGFSEELKEFTWALGAEFMYDESFALRAGYFNENELKGARKFITLGAGFKYNIIDIDLSYLISATRVVNPLENTLRFSLTFNFGEERY